MFYKWEEYNDTGSPLITHIPFQKQLQQDQENEAEIEL